jgi:hypothetical protein
MGYAIAIGPCLVCHKHFGYNPRRVPSKQNEPVCNGCMNHVNRKREQLGLEPFQIHPEAYEPVSEAEL